MASSKISFNNSDGESLAGILDLPGGKPRATALFAHCFTCSKDIRAAYYISKALNAAGIAVLRFDFTGLGESGGEFAATDFSANVADLLSAADWLQEQGSGPEILIGHSLGGTAVLTAAAKLESVRAVATIAAPSHPAHIKKLFASALDDIDRHGQAAVDLGGRPFTIRREFVEDLDAQRLPESVGRLRKPLMILHSPVDEVVDIDNASDLFRHAMHPKSFVSLDNADHLLSRAEDARYIGSVLSAWACKYLAAAAGDELSAGDGEVAARTLAGGFFTDLQAGAHALSADEPEAYGGSDLGPSPYDLLAAALASCTSMTLQMYARHKKLDLQAATVRVSHKKIHARDCDDCETSSSKIDEFQRVVSVTGNLSNDERNRLLEIADRCPVHRTLHGEVKVRSTLADPDAGESAP